MEDGSGDRAWGGMVSRAGAGLPGPHTHERHSVTVVFGRCGRERALEAERLGRARGMDLFPDDIRHTSDAFDLLRRVGWGPVVCTVRAGASKEAAVRLNRLFLGVLASPLPDPQREALTAPPDAVTGGGWDARVAAALFWAIGPHDRRVAMFGAATLDAWSRARIAFVPVPVPGSG